MSHTTILFLHDVSCLAGVAFSPAYLVRLAPRPARSAQRSLCPSDLHSVPAVAGLADLAVVGLVVGLVAALVVAVAAVADPVSGLACLGSVAVVAVAVASPSP